MFGFVASRLGLSFWDTEAKSLMGGVLSACPIPGASHLCNLADRQAFGWI